jgi:hypothetical protein
MTRGTNSNTRQLHATQTPQSKGEGVDLTNTTMINSSGFWRPTCSKLLLMPLTLLISSLLLFHQCYLLTCVAWSLLYGRALFWSVTMVVDVAIIVCSCGCCWGFAAVVVVGDVLLLLLLMMYYSTAFCSPDPSPFTGLVSTLQVSGKPSGAPDNTQPGGAQC